MDLLHFSLSVAFSTIICSLQGVQASSCPKHVTEIKDAHTSVHKHMCYLFVDKEVYWKEARSKCWDLGGEMVAIEDEETMEYIKEKLNSDDLRWDRQGVWLGARYTGGRWRWTNGREMSYKNWASGEPSKIFGPFSVEDCAQMRQDKGWQWHDHPCGGLRFHYNYICQFPLTKPGDNAGRVASSASNQGQDNGNASILAIIVGLSCGLLLIMFIIFLLLHFHHRRNKQKANNEAAVHFSNGSYHNAPESSSVLNTPPVPCSRPPLPPTDDLYLAPKDVTDMYAEVNKPTSDHLHSLNFSPKTCTCNNVQTDGTNSVCSSGPSSELGACGGSDPEAEARSPLMSSMKTNGVGAKSNGVAGPCCGNCSAAQGEYIDMNSMKSVNGKCLHEEEEKHTYSNVDMRESVNENHYEVLP